MRKPFDYYLGKDLLPPMEYMSKPFLPKKANAQEAMEYATKLKEYEEYQVLYKADRAKWSAIINEREVEFKKDLYEEYGVSNNPKANDVWSKAWEFGHSSGLQEVYNYFIDLVDLIK